MTRSHLLLTIVFLLLSGCTHQLSYTQVGEIRPGGSARVVESYDDAKANESPEVNADDVKIYLQKFPPGVTMSGGAISVGPSSTRQVLGTFTWATGGLAPTEQESLVEFAKVAKAAGGNEVVLLKRTIDQGYVHAAEGVVFLNEAAPAAHVFIEI